MTSLIYDWNICNRQCQLTTQNLLAKSQSLWMREKFKWKRILGLWKNEKILHTVHFGVCAVKWKNRGGMLRFGQTSLLASSLLLRYFKWDENSKIQAKNAQLILLPKPMLVRDLSYITSTIIKDQIALLALIEGHRVLRDTVI